MAGAVTRERFAVPPCRPGDKARFSTRFATRECDHLLQRLESEELVQLAVWKLKGHTNPEIGAKRGPGRMHRRTQAATNPQDLGPRRSALMDCTCSGYRAKYPFN